MTKLKEGCVVTIHVLHQQHTSHAEIARRIGSQRSLRTEFRGVGSIADSDRDTVRSESACEGLVMTDAERRRTTG